jgi:lipid-A-disaccharide synthase
VIGVLPGSRNQEVTRNIPEMLRAARRVHAARPDTRFLVAAFNEHQAEMARTEVARWRMPVDVHVGRTPEIIELAECCIAVSGSVSLEMMYRRTPAVIVYRMRRLDLKVAKMLVKVPYITLVNLLAGEEVFPEFPTDRDPSDAVAARVLEFLNDPVRRQMVRKKLDVLCDRVAKPGACAAAARFIVSIAAQQPVSSARPS